MFKLSSRNFLISLGFLAAVLLAAAAFNQKKPAPVAAVEAVPAKAAAVNSMYTPGLAPERRAFSAAEEAYALALWRIHDKVKSSAVQMSFAGLSYKLKQTDAAGVKTKVLPQLEIYRTALADLGKLAVPESMAPLQKDYQTAVQKYEKAALEIMKIADDGKEQHLLDAHSESNSAATLLLKVSSELWPGEFKPN